MKRHIVYLRGIRESAEQLFCCPKEKTRCSELDLPDSRYDVNDIAAGAKSSSKRQVWISLAVVKL